MNWVVGKRVLYRAYWSSSVSEGQILEISPNGEYVKVRTLNDYDGWLEKRIYKIVDVLTAPSSQPQG